MHTATSGVDGAAVVAIVAGVVARECVARDTPCPSGLACSGMAHSGGDAVPQSICSEEVYVECSMAR